MRIGVCLLLINEFKNMNNDYLKLQMACVYYHLNELKNNIKIKIIVCSTGPNPVPPQKKNTQKIYFSFQSKNVCVRT